MKGSSYYLKLGLIILVIIASCKKKEVPAIETLEVSYITESTAICGGMIISEGSGSVEDRGVCWSKEISPTIGNNLTSDGQGAGKYISTLTGLQAGTVYYVKAYASNIDGIGYGIEMSFKTPGGEPSLSVQSVSGLTLNSVTLHAQLNPNYSPTIVKFEYGLISSYGYTLMAESNPYSGNALIDAMVHLTSLPQGTTYHYRITASNSLGIIVSGDQTFRTLGDPPEITSLDFISCGSNAIVLAANVNPSGLSTSLTFEYGTSISYGSTSIPASSPIGGNSILLISNKFSGLTPGTLYHFRLVAQNQSGISYSGDKTFSTTSDIADYDNNLYATVVIGTQTWMAENIRTVHYNDGSEIPLITSGSAWAGLTTGAYCNFANNSSNSLTYGSLYNWYAVNDSRNICPSGWQKKKKAEWTSLISFLGGSSVAGGKLKETGSSNWMYPNTGAVNSSGFSGLGGSFRDFAGVFGTLGEYGYWWTSTEYYGNISVCERLNYSGVNVNEGDNNKISGFSVRCIKD